MPDTDKQPKSSQSPSKKFYKAYKLLDVLIIITFWDCLIQFTPMKSDSLVSLKV